ncbi:MAG: hypothetical protein WCT11_04000 [Candidatus Magasanikbacteria bacterium]
MQLTGKRHDNMSSHDERVRAKENEARRKRETLERMGPHVDSNSLRKMRQDKKAADDAKRRAVWESINKK